LRFCWSPSQLDLQIQNQEQWLSAEMIEDSSFQIGVEKDDMSKISQIAVETGPVSILNFHSILRSTTSIWFEFDFFAK